MKFTLPPLVGLLPALVVASLHAQGLGTPVLSTPGTATWLTETTTTGTRMVFTITGNTVLDWGQFNLGSGSELVFDFVGGDSVANLLNGTSSHSIAGTVTSNGNVGFFAPNGALRVSGSVTARNVTLATMSVDPGAFNSGGDITLTAVSGSTLSVSGSVQATGGNVLLAGKGVRVSGAGSIQATDTVRMAGGSGIKVRHKGIGRRLDVKSGDGFVLHLGESRANRIEIAAGKEINNGGRLDAGSNRHRIFLEVGRDGKILREGSGLMIGSPSIKGAYDPDGIKMGEHEADAAAVLSTSTVKMPALKRPDGSQASAGRTLVNEIPVSASADSGRDRKRPSQQVASRDKAGKSLYRAGSFFGMRGGSTAAKKR